MKCRLIILHYNGVDLLKSYLGAVVEAARLSKHECSVTLLDNGSTDESLEYVASHFPTVQIYKAAANKVLCSFNEIAAKIDDDIMILLNNDIRPQIDFVDPLIQTLSSHSDAFFASCYGDRSIPKSRWGTISSDIFYDGFENAILKEGYVFSAGVGAFDRKKFLELGGYDELYLPGYYEDVDLCFRGWKKGYKGYYTPSSRQFHAGGATFTKAYKVYERQKLVARNGFLFMIKNISNVSLLLRFIFGTIARLLSSILFQKKFLIAGFLEALNKWPDAMKARTEVKKHFSLSDQEVFTMIKKNIYEK